MFIMLSNGVNLTDCMILFCFCGVFLSVRSSAIDVFARCSSSNDPAIAVAISMLVTPRNIGQPANPCTARTPQVHTTSGLEAGLNTSRGIVKS